MIDTGLQEKVAIVTGGAAGIGRATAVRFAREGARVAVWDVNREAGEAVVSEITDAGGTAAFFEVNVADSEAVDAAADAVATLWGRVDVLVNNAGIVRDAQLVRVKEGQVVARMSDEQFQQVIDVNLKGVFNCTRAVAPSIIACGGGVILNASSVACLDGNFGQTNYVATKSAAIGMTMTWARELARYGIRVNAVAPGFVKTEIVSAMPEKVLEGMVGRTPLGRIGSPEDIAEAYLWLASSAASFVTGITLSVDGGLVIGT
jgi:3-oxoacyl-[acyl-carrier protein] reductase